MKAVSFHRVSRSAAVVFETLYYGDKEITKEEYDSYSKEGVYEEIRGSVRASAILAYLEAVKLPE